MVACNRASNMRQWKAAACPTFRGSTPLYGPPKSSSFPSRAGLDGSSQSKQQLGRGLLPPANSCPAFEAVSRLAWSSNLSRCPAPRYRRQSLPSRRGMGASVLALITSDAWALGKDFRMNSGLRVRKYNTDAGHPDMVAQVRGYDWPTFGSYDAWDQRRRTKAEGWSHKIPSRSMEGSLDADRCSRRSWTTSLGAERR